MSRRAGLVEHRRVQFARDLPQVERYVDQQLAGPFDAGLVAVGPNRFAQILFGGKDGLQRAVVQGLGDPAPFARNSTRVDSRSRATSWAIPIPSMPGGSAGRSINASPNSIQQ